MRTIGRHYPRNAPRNDFVANCDYCGVPYYRSRMLRDRSGYLACPRDRKGRDVVTLTEANAASAQEPLVNIDPIDGGNYVLGPINTGTPPSVT